MFHCLPNIIETKKTPKFFLPNSGHSVENRLKKYPWVFLYCLALQNKLVVQVDKISGKYK